MIFSSFPKFVITFDPDVAEKCFAPILKDNWKDFPNKIFLGDFFAAKKAKKGLEICRKKAVFELSTLKLNISAWGRSSKKLL